MCECTVCLLFHLMNARRIEKQKHTIHPLCILAPCVATSGAFFVLVMVCQMLGSFFLLSTSTIFRAHCRCASIFMSYMIAIIAVRLFIVIRRCCVDKNSIPSTEYVRSKVICLWAPFPFFFVGIFIRSQLLNALFVHINVELGFALLRRWMSYTYNFHTMLIHLEVSATASSIQDHRGILLSNYHRHKNSLRIEHAHK